MNKDKSLKAQEQKFVLLMVGNNETGKKTICKEMMKKYQFVSEENKTFYISYNFIYEETFEDCKLTLPMEIRVMNGDEIDTDLKINSSFFKKAYGAYVVTAIDDDSSFQDGAKWKEKIDIMCCLPNKFPLPIFLLINKCEKLDGMGRSPWMDKMELENYVKENQFYSHSFLSSQNNLTTLDLHLRDSVITNQSVDAETPLKNMIKIILQFRDLKEKLIYISAEMACKIKTEKTLCDSSFNNSCYSRNESEINFKNNNSRSSKCLIL